MGALTEAAARQILAASRIELACTSNPTVTVVDSFMVGDLRMWQRTRFQDDEELVFCHPQKGTALDPSRLSRVYLRPALREAGINKPIRPFHDLRHTALTHEAAAGNPMAYVQHRAGHSQSAVTERYIHTAQILFPGAAARGESRLFGTHDLDSQTNS